MELFSGGRGYGGRSGQSTMRLILQRGRGSTKTEEGRETRVLSAFYVTHELQQKL